MKLSFKLFLVLSITLLINACTESNVTNITGYDKTLVIITDNALESEFMIDIMGSVKKDFPNVEITYIRSKSFDIFEAGYLLSLMSQSYSENTYFAVIVEPGANTERIIFDSGKRMVIAPDNGSSTKIRKLFAPQSIHYIDNLSIFDGQYSNIKDVPFQQFYRESILAMLSGKSLQTFGSVCSNPVEIDIQEPNYDNNIASGQILLVDNFGNCETNLSKQFFSQFQMGDFVEIISEKGSFIAKYGVTYSSVEKNENVVFMSDQGRLTLTANFANISERYGLIAGTLFQVKKAELKVGILRYNSSDLVNNIIAGMKSSLTTKGFLSGQNVQFIEKNALGNVSNFPELIIELIAEGVDIVVPVSTPASQAALQLVPEYLPVVYTYVTSPEFAGLINKRVNTTGLSDATNFDDYLQFVKELKPSLKVAGRIYNPSEPNSAYSQERFNSLGTFYGLTYINATISDVQQISNAFNLLKNDNVEAILIAADNTLNLGLKDLAELCKENKIILIGDSDENVVDGALASISVDYNLLSAATGLTVGNVLLGIPAESIPIKRFPTSVITLNQATAKIIGFNFPDKIINKASKIIN
jgi:putative tryptophan/tyrosine transport system substrate-binding protein